MPTYEYRCRDCGEDLEAYQSFTEDALTVCPACGGSLRKLFGNVGISFKGTGFYKNDHGSRSSSGDSNGGSESKTECCYALQEKVWVHDPDGAPWEVYTVLADAPVGPHAVPAAQGKACASTPCDCG